LGDNRTSKTLVVTDVGLVVAYTLETPAMANTVIMNLNKIFIGLLL
jgi:hypothetical protein